MTFTFFNLLILLGALAFFIYGMKVMSEGIQKAAGARLRNILRSMTKNRYLGVLTGFLITAIVQSSSATTVMTVSFVNAGLISLVESAGIMMGANVGTTITAWIVDTIGFKLKLHHYSLPLLALGVPMLFASNTKIRDWGQFIVGFALLFFGLSELKSAVPDIKNNPEAVEFLKRFAQNGIWSRILFVMVGALLTVIVQSSSAAMTLTLTMTVQGWIPYEVGAAMVLGENIGTTITAEIASLVGNVQAKRSARIHSLFNIIGVTWMIILLPFYLKGLSFMFVNWFGWTDPFIDPKAASTGIAAFHTAFNVTNVLLLIGFVPFLVRAAVKTVKAKDDEENESLEYIGSLVSTPDLSMPEVQEQLSKFSQLTARMNTYSQRIAMPESSKKLRKALKKVKKYEEITDRIDEEISNYATKMGPRESSFETAQNLRIALTISHELERIGDIYYGLAKSGEQGNSDSIELNDSQKDQLAQLYELLDKAFVHLMKGLSTQPYPGDQFQRATEIENHINVLRDEIQESHFKSLATGNYSTKNAFLFREHFNALERIGDHIMNIHEEAKSMI